jgi:hypothetical protein
MSSTHGLCCRTKKRKIISTALIASTILALVAVVITLSLLLTTKLKPLKPLDAFEIRGLHGQLFLVREFDFKPAGSFRTYPLKYTAPIGIINSTDSTLRMLQNATNDVLAGGCLTIDQSSDSGYMVKQCGNKDPEILVLGDSISEIYEKELAAAGFNATDGKRMLEEEDMAALMSELSQEIKFAGFSSVVEDLVTYNKDGKVISN